MWRGYTMNARFGRLYLARHFTAGCNREECLTLSPPPAVWRPLREAETKMAGPALPAPAIRWPGSKRSDLW